jgi:imidazolonepropionase-like amidohydrolase
MGGVAEVRQALAEAREYRERRKLPLADRAPVDLGLDALVDALERRRRVVIVARRADDILTALRIREEFGLDAVIAGATEGYLVRDAIRAAAVPVLVGPVMARTWSELGEGREGSFENAALLDQAGIEIGLMTGYEGYVPKVRVVLFEAAVAAANGLGADRALRAATLGTAHILGIDARKGSLEVGKDADLAVFDGDPFEYASHVCAVVIGGAVASSACR